MGGCVLAGVFFVGGVVVVTGPEQHAATVREALRTGHVGNGHTIDRDGEWSLCPRCEQRDTALAALDELVALARTGNWRLVPDGEMLDPYDAACMRADEAEARADELQRERDEARGEHCVCPEGADGDPCENCGKPEAVTNWKVAYHHARREADQLRAARLADLAIIEGRG